MASPSIYTAAVIGLGQIGMGYDYINTNDTRIVTHASAYHYHPRFKLVAGIDTHPDKCTQFTEKFIAPSYQAINSLEKLNPDVISIATPTPLHYQTIQQALLCHPMLIVCEKPLAFTLNEAQKILTLTRQANCKLIVNYMRRFEPGVHEMKKFIHSKFIGEIHKIIVKYSGGYLNNGSHFVDLLIFLLGNLEFVSTLNHKQSPDAYDYQVDIHYRHQQIDILFLSCPVKEYPIFEMEIICASGILKYSHGGRNIYWYGLTTDTLFHPYRMIQSKPNDIPNDYYRFQWHVVEHIAQYLDGKTAPLSTGTTAMTTLATALTPNTETHHE